MPFPSRVTGTSIVYGVITPELPLEIVSHMGSNGVIFSDGVEADFLGFNHRALATIGMASRKAHLVNGRSSCVPAKPGLDVGLLSHLERIVDLDTQVAHG